MDMIKHSQSTQSNKFAKFLQLLKKEARNGVVLHADKHQSFYKLALSFLIEVTWHIQSTQNRKLIIFLQYIKKKVWQRLLYSIVMQNIQIFYLIQLYSCYLFLGSWGQKRAQPFRSWNSKICHIYLKNILMKWADFLHTDTNSRKRNVNLIIIGWVCSKIGETF